MTPQAREVSFDNRATSPTGTLFDSNGSRGGGPGGRPTNHGEISPAGGERAGRAVLADNFGGKRFNAPNDLIVKRDGTIWFSDPTTTRGASEIGYNGVYRIDPRTKAVALSTKKLASPTGLRSRPTRKRSMSANRYRHLAFPVTANDTPGPNK